VVEDPRRAETGERPQAHGLPCLVALIGFSRGLLKSGYGILRRSGLEPMLIPDAERALHVLGHEIASDGLVLDLTDAATRAHLDEFLELAEARPDAALIVRYQGHLTPEYRARLDAAGARLLSSSEFTFRRLAWHVRTALGLTTEGHPHAERAPRR
jgi:hypothetical protein